MKKAELISQLENAKNNYILGLAAISLFSSGEAREILSKNVAKFGPYTVNFDQVAVLLSNPENQAIAIKEFLLSQLRALIKESFELLKSYCSESGQTQAMQTEPWYQFARLIRNCLSHDFRFVFNERDKAKLPISWRNRTITNNHQHQHLTLDFFGYVETWDLFSEFHAFAVERLD
ncbi:MAG: hypothetical protein KY455_09700 [Euryarchaeota archaeon]|nr:hypothetical protein [Euryarchaeota archaeon]